MRGCVDDIAVIRSMYTTDNNHGAQLEFFTGRHLLDGCFPTIGAWVHYGLGALSDDLPQFISMGPPLEYQCMGATDANYLGPENAGVILKVDPADPLPFARPGVPLGQTEAAIKADLLGRLNRLAALEYPVDAKLRARIKSYELAFRMQTAVPEVLRFEDEDESTRRLYGLDQDVTRPFGQQMLAARRLAERGVRFIQVFHGDGAAGAWDAHAGLRANHSSLCAQVDKPIAGLLIDLKRRGLLDDTVVVWATEFGRTPCAKAPTAATTTTTASRSGWPAAASRGASSTARPTSSASTPSSTGTTSPTSTPRFFTCWGSTRTGSRSPAGSGWRSSMASRSGRFWREGFGSRCSLTG